MKVINPFFFLSSILAILSCHPKPSATIGAQKPSFDWQNATVYFMLTDRFNNGDKSNDFVPPRNSPPAPLRGFMGGDVAGITQKIEEGYFNRLGVNAIWMTPLVQNIEGSVDEGTGTSYGFHGYWTKDWTAFDSRIGTTEAIKTMVKTAHKNGIRVLFDVVLNHTGPVTPLDEKWPDDWVKTGPRCVYKDYETTTNCTLVDNLPDIRTESTTEVSLPAFLKAKWMKEGRYDQEVKELDAFFKRTGYPKRPYFYIIKWLTDMITDFGIDGYRVDTAKHVEEEAWKVLRKEADYAFDQYKKSHPNEVLDDQRFYMVGEVYFYSAGGGKIYDFGNKKVNYFDNGFDALINFDFRSDANKPANEIFNKYNQLFSNAMKGAKILNYISSHDDGSPYDLERKHTYESATKLLLCQGAAQIYYGDEIARPLNEIKASGDAKLRSFMNWGDLNKLETKELLSHWQKLGVFRKNHLAVGAGQHTDIQVGKPYVFQRTLNDDHVVVALDAPLGVKNIFVGKNFDNGSIVRDAYSGQKAKVHDMVVTIDSPYPIILLESYQ